MSRSGVSRRKPARARASGDVASLYRTLARNLPNGTLTLFDRELRFVLAEGTGAGGFWRDALEGKTLAEALPSDMHAVLEPLFRGALAGTAGRHGAGLGLATTYGIIKQSGGYIWAESTAGEGSTFTIYLPWHAPLRAAEAARPAEAPPATGAGETVLVVDDEPAVRLVTKRILQRNGYTVLEASGGHEALRVLREHPGPIQLLLTDVIMPEMNGREVAERVRERRSGIKVLFMSAYSPEAIAHDGLLDEDAAFLRKPFEIGLLLRAVRRTLDGAGAA